MSTDPTTAAPTAFDLDARWALSPSVSVRPERFGALLYDFTTRRLSFLKSRSLLDVLERLDHTATAREALTVVEEAERPAHERALAALARAGTIHAQETR